MNERGMIFVEKKFCTKKAFNPTQHAKVPGFTRVFMGRIEILNPTLSYLILPNPTLNPTPNPTHQNLSIYWGFEPMGRIKAYF